MKWMARQTNIHNTRFLFLVALILGSCSAWHQTQTDTHTHTHTRGHTHAQRARLTPRESLLSFCLSFFFLSSLPSRASVWLQPCTERFAAAEVCVCSDQRLCLRGGGCFTAMVSVQLSAVLYYIWSSHAWMFYMLHEATLL